MKINGETKIIGFLGATYKVSKMYAMYNAAFEALDLNYIYVPFVVEDIKKGIKGIKSLGIHAVGVTIPFKISIMEFLDELTEDAKKIGAVNVVVNKDGKLIGGNTDGKGGVMALKEKTEIRGKKVILLGAGGAARALVHSLKDEGGKVIILNRTIEDARVLAKAVDCQFGGIDELPENIKEADILINATAVGMESNNESLVAKELLQQNLVVLDIVSNMKSTKLLQEAKEMGCTVVASKRMLLWQGIYKFKIFTGKEAPVSIMEEALYGGK